MTGNKRDSDEEDNGEEDQTNNISQFSYMGGRRAQNFHNTINPVKSPKHVPGLMPAVGGGPVAATGVNYN